VGDADDVTPEKYERTVREVHHLGGFVDHHEPEGDEGIDKTEGHPLDRQLNELGHEVASVLVL